MGRRRLPVEKECENGGGVFVTIPCPAKRRFCSRACFHVARTKVATIVERGGLAELESKRLHALEVQRMDERIATCGS